jgi:hypothetical protein
VGRYGRRDEAAEDPKAFVSTQTHDSSTHALLRLIDELLLPRRRAAPRAASTETISLDQDGLSGALDRPSERPSRGSSSLSIRRDV